MAGIAAPWALNLAAMAEAAAATATDYKALVCVFLYGGNDYANTLVPYDTASYAAYQAMRPTFALRARQPGGDARSIRPARRSTAPASRTSTRWRPNWRRCCRCSTRGQLGVHAQRRHAGAADHQAAVHATSRCKLPPKLFSHNDQQSVWQSSAPEGATSGWGGRIGDLFESGNGNATFTCVNVSGNAVFMSGKSAVQYQVSTGGSVPLAGLKSPLFGSSACSDALRTLVTQPRAPPAGKRIQPREPSARSTPTAC